MRRWVVFSAGLAPVVLIGGWTWAASRQPAGYSVRRGTISALAAQGAADRWIMTTALAALGVCHLVTAAGLTDARTAGRALLAVGGLATVLVAAFPQPSAGHAPAATIAFVALAIWPAPSEVPARSIARVATVVLFALLGWFAFELHSKDFLGLSERAVAGAQALWPLIVALVLLARQRQRAARV